MIVQDLTKFAVVLVLLGLVLAIAIFRPQIIPPLSTEPPTGPEVGSDGGGDNIATPTVCGGTSGGCGDKDLPACQARLGQCEAKLGSCTADLGRLVIPLSDLQAQLNEMAGRLREQGAEVARLAAAVQDVQVHLAQTWEALQSEWERLAEERARLQQREATVAEREQRLEGVLRLVVALSVANGLLSVPSVMVLVTLMRQSQGTLGKAPAARTARVGHRGRDNRRYGLPVGASLLADRDNGREKKGVGCRPV